MKNRNRTHRVSVLAQPRYYRRPSGNLQDLLDLPLGLLLGRAALKTNVRFRIPISFQDEDHEYLNEREIAQRLHLSMRTLQRRMKEGSIPFIKVRGRVLFNWNHISDVLERFPYMLASGSNPTNAQMRKGPAFNTSKYSKILGSTQKYF